MHYYEWLIVYLFLCGVLLVMMAFLDRGIDVDLSFRNGMPVQNTALIRFYTMVHPLVRPYMMVVSELPNHGSEIQINFSYRCFIWAWWWYLVEFMCIIWWTAWDKKCAVISSHKL